MYAQMIREHLARLVAADLETIPYAVGAADIPAAGVRAFHIRQRLWWVADAERRAAERHGHVMGGATASAEGATQERQRLRTDARDGRESRALADSRRAGAGSEAEHRLAQDEQGGSAGGTGGRGGDGGSVGDSDRERKGTVGGLPGGPDTDRARSPWSEVIWLPCRDGKARPTKPGLFPLAHGVPNRVGTLRGAGNAICPQAAAEFIGAWCEVIA